MRATYGDRPCFYLISFFFHCFELSLVLESTNKTLIDGVEEGKTPAAQQFGFNTNNTKIPEEASCSLSICLYPLFRFFQISFFFRNYQAPYGHFCHFLEA